MLKLFRNGAVGFIDWLGLLVLFNAFVRYGEAQREQEQRDGWKNNGDVAKSYDVINGDAARCRLCFCVERNGARKPDCRDSEQDDRDDPQSEL
jgi:hypothetical protein